MGDNFITSTVTVLMAIIGLAIISVLVSSQAQTGTVISQAGNAFANLLGAAESPVTSSGGLGGLGNALGNLGTGTIHG